MICARAVALVLAAWTCELVAAGPLRADGPATPAAPAAPAAGAGALLSDLRVGLALQERLASRMPQAGVERMFAQLLQASPDSPVLRFLNARAQRSKSGCLLMRSLLLERLGLPVTERAQIGAGWFALGRAQAELGLLDEALESAGFALRLDARADTHALLGWIYQRKDDAPRALRSYRQAVHMDPRNVQARLVLTDLLLRGARTAEALQLARGTLLVAPRSALGQLYWGTALALSGSVEEGRKAYQRALRLAGQDPATVAAVAAALRRIDGQALALDALRRTHATHPEHADVAVQLAGLLVEIGRAGEARAVAEAALKTSANDARLWYLRGTAEEADAEPRTALSSYARAAKLDPQRLEYRLAHAAASRGAGDPKQALGIYRQAAKSFPAERRARELYGRALLEAQMYTPAAEELEEVTRLAPTDPNPCYLVAVVRGIRLGQLHEARIWMERYVDLGGKEPAALDWLDELRRNER